MSHKRRHDTRSDAFVIETIAIGDELLTGKIADTNSAFVGDRLLREGYQLSRVTVISDDQGVIGETLKEGVRRCDIVICFGGLGPTSDDRTAEAVAAILNTDLVEHEASKTQLLKFYEKRKREVTPHALKQILYPSKANPIPNSTGLAPGFHFTLGTCRFYFLPGVPEEMKAMFVEFVLPSIFSVSSSKEARRRTLYRTWRCIGIHESELQRTLDPLEAMLPKHARLGYRTIYPENHVTLYYNTGRESDVKEFQEYQRRAGRALKEWCYSDGDLSLEEVVLGQLALRGWTIAFAESCTGGLTVQRLTRIPNASDHVWGGFTVYQLDSKKKMLGVMVGVPEEAVSARCTRALAQNARRVSGCPLAASITGYMGPTGGTANDPLGTMYLCVTGERDLERHLVQTGRSREQTQWGASTHLLNTIRLYLESYSSPPPRRRRA